MNSATPTCPKCSQPIPEADINVGKGVAYCRRCQLLHDLSELLERAELDFAPELEAPPTGTWLREDGFGTVVGATHRSLGQAAGLLFVTLFWNGIVSVFVTLAVVSTMQHFHLPQPAWMPNMKGGGDFARGGGLVFLWLFLTPFLCIGAGLLLGFLSSLFGRTEVRLTESDGHVRVAIGPFGWRRRFDPARARSVKIAPGSVTKNGQPQYVIFLESNGGKPIKFGSLLREDRKRFVAAQVNRLLRERSGGGGMASTFSPIS